MLMQAPHEHHYETDYEEVGLPSIYRRSKKKCDTYKIATVLVFIDLEKAFDSVETWSILDYLDEYRVESRYSAVN